MAAPAKSTRWGSFLQQAVAGVEARLDNMLAEGENGAIPPQASQSTAASTTVPSKDQQISQPRSSTSSRTNDRLQERLAKAIAAKNTQPSDARSVTSDSQSNRPSADGGRPGAGTLPKRGTDAPSPANTPAPVVVTTEAAIPNNTIQDEDEIIETSKEDPSSSHRVPNSMESSRASEAQQEGNSATPDQRLELETATTSSGNRIECNQCTAFHAQVEALEARAEQSTKEQQEEMHRYVEQFESMQAKLQFLARDATDAARMSAAAAPTGSHERVLAERDVKITALMDEGRNLAATEQKHRAIIRKLRTQIASDEKTLGELRARQEKLTADIETLRPRASRVEELEQSNQELQIKSNGMQDELSALRDEVSTNKSTMQRLRDDLRRASDQASSAVGKVNEEALAAEKRRVKDLEDTVAALQLERNLIAGRAKESAAEAEEKVARAAERARAKELEMKVELQAMEGKLEAMRALAEEASSGAVGDSQVKLLRQVETLQTQHAIAAENWQGIEASLIARVANLERERDDALRQNAEAALSQARLDLEKQQAAWKTETIELDRRPWLEDHLSGPGSRIQSRPDSPLLSVPTRTMSNDLLLLHSVSGKGRKISTPTSGTDGFQEGSQLGRRLSSQPPARPPMLTSGSNLPVAPSITSFELPPDSLPTPTSYAGDKDDLFDGVETSSSPRQMMQDMVSVSTVGAGPSVQLVERMSAAIRRLEAEKVTSREELARISGQRDEARAEIVSLMKELESSKTASKRVTELEGQVEDLNSRYQTTLELLGEKSELVEELRADVQDVKAMYRDLVERTIR
ncbi:hypothetical protein SGCOL_011561 [Colletotrichum sp. CLE4]